ncbi:thiol:disulfide interchange protein DsbA/DsbL [Hydrocarboniphaga sp.]|uniref:thiol:disulfide interchange protein DsbA/DsbL n=1 Tax=Hydrocarboniphaga sp. TaxID=2033016 RepID=UPI003D102579
MKLRPLLLMSLLLSSLAACSPKAPPAEPAEPAAAAAPAETAAPAEPAPAESAAATAGSSPAVSAAPAAAAAPATAPEAKPAEPAPAPAAAAAAPALTAPPVEGTDYVTIEGGEPFAPVPGKIELVEYFNYVCPACASFNPDFQQWKAKLPGNVHVVYIAADFRGDFVPYARAYYAAESFGLVEKTHDEVYKAVHETHALPGEGGAVDEAKIADWYAAHGAPGAEMFLGAMRSFSVDVQLKKGRAFAMHSKVSSTPSLIINGKYLVKGKSWDEKLAIATWLIDRERAGKK